MLTAILLARLNEARLLSARLGPKPAAACWTGPLRRKLGRARGMKLLLLLDEDLGYSLPRLQLAPNAGLPLSDGTVGSATFGMENLKARIKLSARGRCAQWARDAAGPACGPLHADSHAMPWPCPTASEVCPHAALQSPQLPSAGLQEGGPRLPGRCQRKLGGLEKALEIPGLQGILASLACWFSPLCISHFL